MIDKKSRTESHGSANWHGKSKQPEGEGEKTGVEVSLGAPTLSVLPLPSCMACQSCININQIIINEPYTDGPGGSGQYTKKIFHIASKIPSWLRAMLPKDNLRVEEEV